MNLELKGRTEIFTSDDVIKESHKMDYTNQIVILNIDELDRPYQKPQFQIWVAVGGFGCRPNTLGSAVFAISLEDGEKARFTRGQFAGILKPELVSEYRLEEIDND